MWYNSTMKGGAIMGHRKLESHLVNRNDITEEMRLIAEAKDTYITPTGKVYVDYGNNMMFPLSAFTNNQNGYLYVNLTNTTGKRIQRRVHVLVAKAYLPNPYNYPYVCHKDDNKANPVLTNLEWGTPSSNTKDAYDRGLAHNDKGWDDSQSKPVCCFDTQGNLLKIYGSVSIASKETNMTKRGITYQCDHLMHTKPRKGYLFRYYTEYQEHGFVL